MTYYKKQFFTPTYNKKADIEKMVERKERGIADYTSKQEVSIAVSAAMRDASNYCINHPDWKTDLSLTQRFEWIDEVAKKFIEFYASKRPDYSELYMDIKSRPQEIINKEETAREIEIDEELAEEFKENGTE